jgi:uncharacterized RmlC-like cupin family protein
MKIVMPDSLHGSIRKWRHFRRSEWKLADKCRTRLLQITGRAQIGWHHHGDRRLSGLCLEGTLRFYFGRGGRRTLPVKPANFVTVPPGIVHREVNPSSGPVRFLLFAAAGTKLVSIEVSR